MVLNRHPRSAIFALVCGALAACNAAPPVSSTPTVPTLPATPPPTSHAVSTQTASAASPKATHAAGATSTVAPASSAVVPSLVALNPLAIDMGPIFNVNKMTNWGPSIWYSTLANDRLYQANLQTGVVSTVAAGDGWLIEEPAANGAVVVWTEARYGGGMASWRVRQFDVSTGAVSIIDSGTNSTSPTLEDTAPVIDVDQTQLAYTAPAPTSANPLASRIVVRDVSSGQIVRAIETDLSVFDLAISKSVVAYSEGHVNTDGYGEFYDSRLMVSRPDGSASVLIAPNAYDVALDGSRLVWIGDAANPALGPAIASRVQTMLLGGSDQTVFLSQAGAAFPSAKDGLVVWSQPENDEVLLVAWTPAGNELALARSTSNIVTSIGGGWLTWQGWNDAPVAQLSEEFFGLSPDAIPLTSGKP